MLYSTFIGQLRTQVGDTRRRVHVSWTANGTDTVFQMPADTFPVYDMVGTYIVRVAGSIIAESTNYTLDKETGTLVLNLPPTNGQIVTIDSSSVYLQDMTWLDIINSVIKSLGDDFWQEFVDDTFVTATNMMSLNLSPKQPNCIAVYDFWYRQNALDNWKTVDTFSNWRFDRENNIIHLSDRNAFNVANEPLRIRGLKAYVLGNTVIAPIDVQDRFLTILEYGSIARYWRHRYKSVVELVSKMSTEQTRTPLQELIMLSDRFERAYEMEKAKLKPAKPPRVIPQFLEGSGRP